VLEYGINVHPKTCRIAKTGNGAPAFNTFWIMGEEDGRRKQMTSDDRQRMGPIVLANETNKVVFKMNAFKEVPLKKKEITIEAKMVDGQCRVKGYVTLNDGREMNLDKIWAKLSYFFGVPTGVNYLQVYGQDRSSGQKFNFKLED